MAGVYSAISRQNDVESEPIKHCNLGIQDPEEGLLKGRLCCFDINLKKKCKINLM